jgi:hypothetical protein
MGLVQPAKCLGFKMFMAMIVKKTIIFRNVTPFSLVDRYRSPGETSCLHVQGISGSPLLQNVGTYLGNTKVNHIPKTVTFKWLLT